MLTVQVLGAATLLLMHFFNAGSSPEGYWREPTSQAVGSGYKEEAGDKGDGCVCGGGGTTPRDHQDDTCSNGVSHLVKEKRSLDAIDLNMWKMYNNIQRTLPVAVLLICYTKQIVFLVVCCFQFELRGARPCWFAVYE